MYMLKERLIHRRSLWHSRIRSCACRVLPWTLMFPTISVCPRYARAPTPTQRVRWTRCFYCQKRRTTSSSLSVRSYCPARATSWTRCFCAPLLNGRDQVRRRSSSGIGLPAFSLMHILLSRCSRCGCTLHYWRRSRWRVRSWRRFLRPRREIPRKGCWNLSLPLSWKSLSRRDTLLGLW